MLENGDLIFVKDLSDMGQAIQASTGSYSHVAIYLDGFIYHASGQAGVICQKLRDFLEPACLYDLYLYPKIDIQKVKKRANQHLGAPYNSSFYPDGEGFYCSQYIAEILPIFETTPMKFGDDGQEISDFWNEYYIELGIAVPLNQPGTNPSQLATSPLLECKERNLHDSDF
ncbi:UDP-N-acetylmuramoylalanyl-D-glutamate--2,6-diaminopimelate ligase [Streptococcus oralis subsp. tigurinus]|uniref:UDP-N-acetylmuramoylalanyl-D-glutamate--2, 6-diaminopimelate ligase n=1 Tax=Streptococcus oralis subsp. tigurinus TaxID=1077464 RepID=A0A1X0WY43_STROR|nr:YiiX/YebB-like N1pC/P60 family cysteine hydrolase [Streptococcus oralis]ORJ31730.1 UDP-N-acetylmuramoylalanyl-D-glutamate--2,6-diaminopimelate ligase [Streptococcus oralis subsp. tigurinus]